MKKIIIPILIAVASALPMHAQTVLVVDISGVFNNLIEVKAKLQQINATTETYRTYLNNQGADLQKLQTEADQLQQQADNPANLQDSRDAYRKQAASVNDQITKEKTDIQSFYQNSQNVIQTNQQTLVQEQLEKIKTAVKGIAEKKKASLVLNSSALGMLAPVLYSDGKTTIDVTKDVLDELNADATAAAAANPASTTAPAGASLPSLMPTTGTDTTATKPAASSATK